MRLKFRWIWIPIMLLGVVLAYAAKQPHNENYIPAKGFVPDEETAVKIAEAVWFPIYGENIHAKKPFSAALKNDSIWIVTGTLPEGMKGGVPYAEISKYDCKILSVSHGK